MFGVFVILKNVNIKLKVNLKISKFKNLNMMKKVSLILIRRLDLFQK